MSRIPFKTHSQADRLLNHCRRLLTNSITAPEGTILPWKRTRNAFSRGLGYSSYDSLMRKINSPSRPRYSPPSDPDLLAALTSGFVLAFDVAQGAGFTAIGSTLELAPRLAYEAAVASGEFVDEAEILVDARDACWCGSGFKAIECCAGKSFTQAGVEQIPGIQEAIAAELNRKKEQWYTESIPGLGGLTPNDAAKTTAGRAKLEELFVYMRQFSPESAIVEIRRRLKLPLPEGTDVEIPSLIDDLKFVQMWIIFDRRTVSAPFSAAEIKRQQRCLDLLAQIRLQYRSSLEVAPQVEETEEGGPNRAIHVAGTENAIESVITMLSDGQLLHRCMVVVPDQSGMNRFKKYIKPNRFMVGLREQLEKVAEDQAREDMHDEFLERLDRQFVEQFGRHRTPDDPLMWDPQSPTPKPISGDEVERYFLARMIKERIPHQTIYAMKKLGGARWLEHKQKKPAGDDDFADDYYSACQEYDELEAMGKAPKYY